MIADPRFAPKRTDLPWLRRRRLPRAPHEPEATPGAPRISFDRPEQSRSTTNRPAAPISFDRPERRSAAPPPPPPPPPPTPVPAASSSLDLDEPSAPPRPTVSSSLDLDRPAPQRAPAPAAPAPAVAPRRERPTPRVRPGERRILTPADPSVTLTRLQSAIGTLGIEAACSAEVGDLRLGCAYELVSGTSTTMQMTQGNRLAPPHSRRPILVGGREPFENIGVDLRQCRELRRLIVYAFSEARRPLNWGGTLIVTTHGGARVEVPLESLQDGDVAVLVSLYNVHGEFVLRAEMQTLHGDVREASRAYGYDRITWLDGRTPVE